MESLLTGMLFGVTIYSTLVAYRECEKKEKAEKEVKALKEVVKRLEGRLDQECRIWFERGAEE